MKVTRKVRRRKHSRSSSISRRILRNNKNKNSYRKKHTSKWRKTRSGHKCARMYKRGKKFHMGGSTIQDGTPQDGTPQDKTPQDGTPQDGTPQDGTPQEEDYTSAETLVPDSTTTNIPCLKDNELPVSIVNFKNRTKMDNALYFKYKRTDKFVYKLKSEIGLFDVVILWRGDLEVFKIILLRRSKNNLSKYDKKFIIEPTQFNQNYSLDKPFTDIVGFKIDSDRRDSTYTLSKTTDNKKNLYDISQYMWSTRLEKQSQAVL